MTSQNASRLILYVICVMRDAYRLPMLFIMLSIYMYAYIYRRTQPWVKLENQKRELDGGRKWDQWFLHPTKGGHQEC